MDGTTIAVQAEIFVPVEDVWKNWTTPEDIKQWNTASDDWHTPRAKNDLKTGGRFVYRMEAKDKSAGFDFSGTYTEVVPNKLISYTIDDDRKVIVEFRAHKDRTTVIETFEAEETNPIDMQRQGWQAILNNFKHYVEK
ncbi:SRPBCC family protein [Saccharicrinis sp. FJH54]|uniref:SRPBCC family protein n=1 Tax=Saccharicrinis sp. FJH54 TaxID=3344665 RepID=UPI0035D3F4DB